MNKEKQISVDTFIEIYNFFIKKDKNYNEEKKEEILSEIASTLEDIEYVIGDIKEKLHITKSNGQNYALEQPNSVLERSASISKPYAAKGSLHE